MPVTAPRLAVVAAVCALPACVTGERPTLVPEPPVNDPAVETVLERLDRAGSTAFTAVYDIIPSSTGTTTTATVRQGSDGRRRVTVGEIDYVVSGSTTRTCTIESCVDGLDDARISNLNITHRFWGDSFASRLRLDATRNIADGRGRVETIAGQPAACVGVPVIGGTVDYCALDAGVLGRYFGADVSIELTSYTQTVDDALLDR
ncbi:MAG: hypothetical protein QNJ12_03115 [Ilumatobacter sp.]|uniref:hypothetical protein n=1 Tax=Ilumatobacter sp. TaxID=1967498 RepID=UPI002637305D|nr:hypothetical protein [Ilumatobacter sp.]MDJ0767750.1 hypothetical protein [Ilumatobacter sp.]